MVRDYITNFFPAVARKHFSSVLCLFVFIFAYLSQFFIKFIVLSVEMRRNCFKSQTKQFFAIVRRPKNKSISSDFV